MDKYHSRATGALFFFWCVCVCFFFTGEKKSIETAKDSKALGTSVMQISSHVSLAFKGAVFKVVINS